MRTFTARLSPMLFGFSFILSVFVLALAALQTWNQDPLYFIAIVPSIFILALLISVKDYAINNKMLLVRRIGGWTTEFDLSSLNSVRKIPGLMWRSLSFFSTHGLFGVVGWAYNSSAGLYRVYATNPRKSILLEFENGSKLLVTPEEEQHFLKTLRVSED